MSREKLIRGVHFEVVAYDRERHATFVLGSDAEASLALKDAIRARRLGVLVAHVLGAPDDLLGYLAHDEPWAWAYVRPSQRRRHVMRGLLEVAGLEGALTGRPGEEILCVPFSSPDARAIAAARPGVFVNPIQWR